jgi:hypothetical protein
MASNYEGSMQADPLRNIDAALQRLVQVAEHLAEGDSEGHVRRSVEELRAAFAGRAPVEPAVARVVRSLQMFTSTTHDRRRREFANHASGISKVGTALEELLPELRRIGFEV